MHSTYCSSRGKRISKILSLLLFGWKIGFSKYQPALTFHHCTILISEIRLHTTDRFSAQLGPLVHNENGLFLLPRFRVLLNFVNQRASLT